MKIKGCGMCVAGNIDCLHLDVQVAGDDHIGALVRTLGFDV